MVWRKTALSLAVLWLAAIAGAQEWKQGKGRLEGNVADEKGAPIADATVKLRFEDSGKGPDLKTNNKGHWAILGLTGGSWTLEASAPGHTPFKQSLQVRELARSPSVDVQLGPEVQQQPQETVVMVGGQKISKETAASIEKANEAIKSKNYAEAEAGYLKALEELPDNPSVMQNIALAYYFDQKYDEALKYSRKVTEKNPENTTAWLMVAELELQKGSLEEGKAALEKVPAEKITSSEPYLNVGILYYNKSKTAEAEEYFTKAIEKTPGFAEAYYYRGLARFQGKKNAGARADFQKYLELEPNGKEASTVKEILKSFK